MGPSIDSYSKIARLQSRDIQQQKKKQMLNLLVEYKINRFGNKSLYERLVSILRIQSSIEA